MTIEYMKISLATSHFKQSSPCRTKVLGRTLLKSVLSGFAPFASVALIQCCLMFGTAPHEDMLRWIKLVDCATRFGLYESPEDAYIILRHAFQCCCIVQSALAINS